VFKKNLDQETGVEKFGPKSGTVKIWDYCVFCHRKSLCNGIIKLNGPKKGSRAKKSAKKRDTSPGMFLICVRKIRLKLNFAEFLRLRDLVNPRA